MARQVTVGGPRRARLPWPWGEGNAVSRAAQNQEAAVRVRFPSQSAVIAATEWVIFQSTFYFSMTI
jgi:hypothetical protein